LHNSPFPFFCFDFDASPGEVLSLTLPRCHLSGGLFSPGYFLLVFDFGNPDWVHSSSAVNLRIFYPTMCALSPKRFAPSLVERLNRNFFSGSLRNPHRGLQPRLVFDLVASVGEHIRDHTLQNFEVFFLFGLAPHQLCPLISFHLLYFPLKLLPMFELIRKFGPLPVHPS